MSSFSETESTTPAPPSIADPRTQLLSFDLYERYTIASRVVRTLRRSTRCSVLDVGGYSDTLWPGFESLVAGFLPEVDSFVIDVHREPGRKNYAVGSGAQLPFADRSFDFVLAQDTLEHIPAEARRKFIEELVRVSRGFVLLSFPFFTPLNEACDRLIYRFIQIRKNVDLPALKEHLEFGLPKLDDVREWFEAAGFPFRIWTHGSALVWLNMMMAKNHLWAQGVPEFEQELDAVFNTHFAEGDRREPCYRAFAVIGEGLKERATLETLDGLWNQSTSVQSDEAIYSLCKMIMSSVSSVEVERRTQHSINLLEDLGHRIASGVEGNRHELVDRDTRLAEATSQARHFQNLLEEQQQQRVHAEVLLQEATSRALHYQNLLEGEQQHRIHAETLLQEATSRALHYQNLLEEQQQVAGDAMNRLAEKTSLARHNENLLEELRQRASDWERQLAESVAETNRSTELLEALRCKLAESEARALEIAHGEEQAQQAFREGLGSIKQQLTEEQSARKRSEEELGEVRAKLARFPVRLFVR